MKLQAIYFCGNDKTRLLASLAKFKTFHPDIDTLVVDNGNTDSFKEITSFPNTWVKKVPNIWHKKTHCGVGSFDNRFFDYLFEWGLRDNGEHTHTVYMETDVLTTRRVSIVPKYDMAGPLHPCGKNELFLYDKFGINHHRFHAGCGGTVFSYDYFKKIRLSNYHLFKELFEDHPESYFMDLIGFLVGRDAGCTFGNWEESSDIKERFILDERGNYVIAGGNSNATFLHNWKLVD